MDLSDLVLVAAVLGLALVALVVGGPARLAEGGRETIHLLSTVWFRILLGFILAGLVSVLTPTQFIGRHLGEGSGVPGLVVATVAGSLTPGGPFIKFPLVAALSQAGAGPGAVTAYLTAWSLISVNRTLVWEIPLLGYQFTAARLLVSVAAPVLLGLAVPPVLRLITR